MIKETAEIQFVNPESQGLPSVVAAAGLTLLNTIGEKGERPHQLIGKIADYYGICRDDVHSGYDKVREGRKRA